MPRSQAPSFVPGPATTPPPAGLNTQLPGASSFAAGCTTQPPMEGCSTRLPPGMANGCTSFAGSSIASQVGSFRTEVPGGGSFAMASRQSFAGQWPAHSGQNGAGLQSIRE
jgi:hypothetical protein